MKRIIIKNANVVNEGKINQLDLMIEDTFIARIDRSISHEHAEIIDAGGMYLLPGIIDDQVHFREPGMIYKGDIFTESRAAVAGGITSYLEMPNTIPHAVTRELLEDKFRLAEGKSLANYSFYIGATNDNLDELLEIDPGKVCGVKIFMGSSTGNMLVDDGKALESIFSNVSYLIATHCEHEDTIRKNIRKAKVEFNDDVPLEKHPEIRSEAACFISSSLAVNLAKKYDSRLHILHISTGKELELFRNDIPLREKKITSEACIHHLWFSDQDYQKFGNRIKWNPAIKTSHDRQALRDGVRNGNIDVIATDHAPHTWEEKQGKYFQTPAGGPLVQHALVAMLELCHLDIFDLSLMVQKMAHNPSLLFEIDRRGFIREGFYADLVLVNLNDPWTVSSDNILYKCGWSPFEGITFRSKIDKTYVNGCLVYDSGKILGNTSGMRLRFNR